MHVAIRRYQLADPTSIDELLRRINEGFISIIKFTPGFLAYYVLDSGGGTVTSVSIFESQKGAEESNRREAQWVGENLTSMVPDLPEIIAGEVVVHELDLIKLGVRKVTE